MTKNHNVASAIRACRESRGYSQEYMADMLEICQSAYANLEAGKTSLSIDRLIRITDVLEMDIHALITAGKGNAPVVKAPSFSLSDDTRQAYDALIAELKTEVEFLRELVRGKLIH